MATALSAVQLTRALSNPTFEARRVLDEDGLRVADAAR